MSGSASIQPHVIQWFRAVLGVNIIEGYGQTESTATTSLYLFGDTVPGMKFDLESGDAALCEID